jgi:hypothetical protein
VVPPARRVGIAAGVPPAVVASIARFAAPLGADVTHPRFARSTRIAPARHVDAFRAWWCCPRRFSPRAKVLRG